MNNIINLQFETKSSFSYGYTQGNNIPIEIIGIKINTDLQLANKRVGYISADFSDLIKNQLKFAKKDRYNIEPTIALYESMIEKLNTGISDLKALKKS